MSTLRFPRVAGACAVLAAALAVFYSITFAIVVKRGTHWASWASTSALALGGLVAIPVVVAIYQRARRVDEGFALVALLVGAGSSFGVLLHGANDLAVLFNPPAHATDLPNATDPRGVSTFALLAVGLAVSSWLLVRSGWSTRLATVGYSAAVLLVVVYIGRLTVLDPNRGWIAVAAALSGLLLIPGWYLLVARELLRADAVVPGPPVTANGYVRAGV
jgi:hypothetical protein